MNILNQIYVLQVCMFYHREHAHCESTLPMHLADINLVLHAAHHISSFIHYFSILSTHSH